MKNPFPYALLASCLVGIFSSVLGQDDSTSSERSSSSNSGRTMRVVSFGAELDSVFYEHKGKKMELFAGMSYLSDSMPMPKGEMLNLYREVQQTSEDTKETKIGYVNVGAVPLVKGSKAIVLLVVPMDLTKEKIKGRAFQDSLAIHPAETARVFNLSTKVVGVRAGKEALKLPVGGSGVMPWKAVAFNSVAYQIATEGKEPGAWDLIESAECAAHSDMRTFAFVSEAMIEETKTVTATTFLDPIPDRNSERNGNTP